MYVVPLCSVCDPVLEVSPVRTDLRCVDHVSVVEGVGCGQVVEDVVVWGSTDPISRVGAGRILVVTAKDTAKKSHLTHLLFFEVLTRISINHLNILTLCAINGPRRLKNAI